MTDFSQRAGGFTQPVRLNRFLARCGVASRRACDSLIEDGAVEVNGQVVRELATLIQGDDKVLVNGIRVKPKPPQAILMHKPKGLTCSQSDEEDKETIYSCLPPNLRHLQHVGRLDRDSEGLLVLTNDGDFSQELAHPRHKVDKEYLVTLHEAVSNEVLDRLLGGVRISEGQVKFDAVARVSPRRVRVVIQQGYKRQVRRMFATMGLQVRKLVRIRVGSLWLDDMAPGRWRFLEPGELKLLTENPGKIDKVRYFTKENRELTKKREHKKFSGKGRRRSGPGSKPSGPGRPGGKKPGRRRR